MNALLFYLIKSTFCLGLLFLVYWIFLRRETFFQMNRLFLILAGILSLIMPVLPFHRMMTEPVSALAVIFDPVLITPHKMEDTIAAHLKWFEIIQVIYFTGMIVLLVRFIVQILQLLLLVRRSTIKKAHGCRLVLTDRGYSPFSFFHMIFINERNFNPENLAAIMAHEQVHIRQSHTFDLILAQLLIIIQWFNPFAWLINRELKNIHEFLADEGVIRQGTPAPEYQQMILNESIGIQLNDLANNFNISQLKKRLAMMTQKRSGNWAISKMLLVLPAMIVLGLLFSASTLSTNLTQEKSKMEPKSVGVPVEAPGNTKRVTKVDKQPTYPGGDEARIKFLIENIRYPEQAKKNNVQGTVFVSFNVETNGTISDVKVFKGIGAGCDEEAVRVIKLMPKWMPGELKGKPVITGMVITIRFALDSGKKDEQKDKK